MRTRRVNVDSYGFYAEAQWAVDHLSDEASPVKRVAIVAEDLRFVEQVPAVWDTGRPRSRERVWAPR